MNKKKTDQLNVITSRVDVLIFAGFATGLAFVVALLGFACMNQF